MRLLERVDRLGYAVSPSFLLCLMAAQNQRWGLGETGRQTQKLREPSCVENGLPVKLKTTWPGIEGAGSKQEKELHWGRRSPESLFVDWGFDPAEKPEPQFQVKEIPGGP